MPTAGFETAIPVSKRPQTYALDRAATGMADSERVLWLKINCTEICGVESSCLLGSYTDCSGNFLPTFRDNLSVPSSSVKIGPLGCP